MKCSNCGTENPEGKRFCGDCGAALPSREPRVQAFEAGASPTGARSRVATIIICVLVLALFVSAALALYFSPDYSWSSSIRDSDHDGYPDAVDAFPSEPSQWSDLDGDGHGDNPAGVNSDHFPDDPAEWNDTDGDGVGDNADAFPTDPSRWEASTPVAAYAKDTTTNGKKITIVAITNKEVPWDDVIIQLSDGVNIVTWTPAAADLNTAGGDQMNYTGKALGGLTVCCVVFDLAGNGIISGGDNFNLFTYGGAATFTGSYAVNLLYEPTGDQIGTSIIWTA